MHPLSLFVYYMEPISVYQLHAYWYGELFFVTPIIIESEIL